MIKKTKTQFQFTYLFIGLFFFFYVLIRTISVGITFDEAWTIGTFVQSSFYQILTYEPAIANNHLLNSILIKMMYTSGFETVFLARVPNLFALILYLYFSFKICSTYFKSFSGIIIYILLVANPLALDFFGLARGYGLGLGFLISALYYLLKFRTTGTSRNGIIALMLGSLGVLSNFTFLYFWLGILMLSQFVFIFQPDVNKYQYLRFGGKSLFVCILLGSVIYFPIQKLREVDGLWYGGENGFYEDTLVSLMSYSLGNVVSHEGTIFILNVFLFFLFFGITIFIISQVFYSKKIEGYAILLLLLLIIPISLNIFLHHFLATKYLINRTALFYYPIFILTFGFLIEENRFHFLQSFQNVILLFFSCLCFLNFSRNANFYYTLNWPFDSRTKEVLNYINEKGKEQNKVFILDSTFMFSSVLKYYQWKKKYKYVVYAKDQPDNLDKSLADYFLFYEKSAKEVNYDPRNEMVTLYPRDKVLYFKKEGVLLLSNLKK